MQSNLHSGVLEQGQCPLNRSVPQERFHHVFFVDRVDVLEFSIANPPIENNFSFHVAFFTSSSPLLINRSLHWPDEISPRKFFCKQQ